MPVNPPAAHQQFLIGVTALQGGDWGAAEQAFVSALHLAPDCAEAHANLAWLLEQRGELPEALGHYRQALALNHAQGLPAGQIGLNTAVCLLRLKQLDEALQFARQGVVEQADKPLAWSNLGVILASLQHEAAAEAAYRQALALQPDYATARFNLAYVLLRQGRYHEGWAALQSRPLPADYASFFRSPRWAGEDLHGVSLVIAPEFGAGDLIQFCRFIPHLKARGARHITLICLPGLVPLMRRLAGVDCVLSVDDEVPDAAFDYWSLPLDLPGWLSADRPGDFAAAIPYLQADTSHPAPWGKESFGKSGLRVGLVWRGNPRHENDAERSIPVSTLTPLAAVAGVRWFSLQLPSPSPDAALPAAFAAYDVGAHLRDYADTAAALAGLDLLISVDTSVAHLAGALGKPCWLLLPDYRCDWRWLAAGSQTAWYADNFRLFRQAQDQAWPGVIQAVKAALTTFVDEYHALPDPVH